MTDIDKQICKTLMYIPRLHKIRMSEYASDFDVFGCQLPIIHYIAKNVNPTQKQLADEFRVAPPTMTATIKRLEKSNFITRESDNNDARIMRVRLTEKGIEIEEKTKKTLRIVEKDTLAGFNDDEKNQLFEYLQRITRNLGRDD